MDFGIEWNAENQLKRVLKDSVEVARYAHDPTGRRVERIAGGTTTSYAYDGEDILKQLAGAATVRYLHGPGIDEPLAAENGAGQLTYEHADALGSELKQTDTSGAVTSSRSYDAFGQPQAGASTSGYAFTGREWDPEIQAYYYRARYYDPKVGRFLSEDPIGLRGGPHFYAYADNNPVLYADPLGLSTVPVVPPPAPGTQAAAQAAARAAARTAAARAAARATAARAAAATTAATRGVAAWASAAAGWAIQTLVCVDKLNEDEECELQREEDEERCRNLKSPRERALCWANAMDRYADCLSGRTPRPRFP